MKIAFVGDYINTKVGRELFKRISLEESDVEFYCYFQDGSIYNYYQKFFGYEKVSKNLYRVGILKLLKIVVNKQPDVIHITTLHAFYLPVIFLKKLLNSKIIFLINNIHKIVYGFNRSVKVYLKCRALTIEKILVKYSDKLIVLSKMEFRLINSIYRCNPDKIEILPNGVNDLKLKKVYTKSNDDVTKIVTVAEFERKEKGLDYLLKILSNVNMKIELTVCNNRPQALPTLTLPANVSIKVLEPMNELQLRNEFVKNDLFIALSRYEPFNMSLLEAMSAGLLFIATSRVGYSPYDGIVSSAYIVLENLNQNRSIYLLTRKIN